MAGLPADTWIRLIVWLVIGLVVYFAYGKSHSHLGRGIGSAAADDGRLIARAAHEIERRGVLRGAAFCVRRIDSSMP